MLEVMKWLSNSPAIAQWFQAFGTIFAVIVALYFGLKGNRQTKLLLVEKENILQQSAFLFLTSLPATVTDSNKQASLEFISNFEDLILKNGFYLEQKKLKNYSRIIRLANQFASYPAASTSEEVRQSRRKLFNQIKQEAKELSSTVNSVVKEKGMERLQLLESHSYWDKNVQSLYSRNPNEQYKRSVLIYANDSQKARELAAKKLKDNFYLDENLAGCDTLRPGDYEFLAMKKGYFSDYIKIFYQNKKIKLKANAPIFI